jgi:hypothetical protein
MRLGSSELSRLAQATASDPLRVRALAPGPLRIVGVERGGLLPLPRALERLVVGLRPDGALAGGVCGPGARTAGWTDATGRPITADAPDGGAGDLAAWGPFHARVALGATRLLRLPLEHQGASVIALPR